MSPPSWAAHLRRLSVTVAAALVLALGSASASAVVVAGHRGAKGVEGVPENSSKAFYYAASSGAAVLETDVRWTKDGTMVVLHDATLDRTTRCTGPVESITYVALRTCAPAHVVPTFAAFLHYARAKGTLVAPEIKAATGHPFTAARAKAYVAEINANGMSERTVVCSFRPEILVLVRDQGAPGLRYALITGSGGALSPAEALTHGTVYMPRYTTLTQDSVAAYHQTGLEVWAWGPANTTQEFAAMVALDLDAMVVDDPRGAAAYLRSHASLA